MATEWKGREEHPASAYEIAAGMQNGLALPDTLPQTVRDYFGRPVKILEGARWRPLLRRVYEYSAARPEAVVGASPTRPVMYARYAGEGHWEGTWSYANQVDALERMIAWFDRYLKQEPPATAGRGTPTARNEADELSGEILCLAEQPSE